MGVGHLLAGGRAGAVGVAPGRKEMVQDGDVWVVTRVGGPHSGETAQAKL